MCHCPHPCAHTREGSREGEKARGERGERESKKGREQESTGQGEEGGLLRDLWAAADVARVSAEAWLRSRTRSLSHTPGDSGDSEAEEEGNGNLAIADKWRAENLGNEQEHEDDEPVAGCARLGRIAHLLLPSFISALLL